MKTATYSILTIMLMLFILSCSGSGDPTVPSEARNAQDFLTAIEIFGPDTSPGLENYFHDIALAQLRTAGEGTNPEYDVDHGCIAVTLHRVDNDPANPFKPVFRWLDAEDYGETYSPIYYVTERDDISSSNSAEYRAIACDAIYVPPYVSIDNIESDSIEVVVAYMVRNRPGEPNDGNWDIEVTAMQWDNISTNPIKYYNREPTYRPTRQLSDYTTDTLDEHNPDIAYYHRLADVYMAYTQQEDLSGNIQRINYSHYTRSTNLTHSGFLAQTPDHNGYDPSIDVGTIDIGATDYDWVVVAYTSQYHANHMGYHVNATAWRAGSADDYRPTTVSLRNPNHYGRDAGLPCLDIAPKANRDHIAVCSYTQVIDADGFGPTTGTYVVRFLGDLADLNTHIFVIEPSGPPNFTDTLYSSVAVNRQPPSQDPTDISVSLAFMGQNTDVNHSDNWHPRVGGLRILDVIPDDGGLVMIYTGLADDSGDATIIGNYNLSDIPFQNPGVSSAIMTNNNDRYWAAWNDRIEMEPPPEAVLASYGNARP